MKCPRCQAENPAGMRFCGQCAASLACVCRSCGAANPPENKFCGQCAAPLDKPAQPRFAAPESYTPRHLAEKILTSKAALEGERKQVTVLFADLKGSMELLADRDPEEARKLLDPVLERMMEAVHHYEGTVNQVLGDGIMALFGAPLAHEDHAVRACYAALRMQEAIRRYTEDVRRAHGVEVQIRMGINSGEVVVRSVGSDLRMDYTAVGQTTHLAARMEQIATPGSIFITPETFRLTDGAVDATALGPTPVKGVAEPIDVFEVTGVTTVRSRFHAAVTRGLSEFVGRDPEVAALDRALGRAAGGRGQVVAIVGEAGVGKSRLVFELTHRPAIRSWLVLHGPSVSYGTTTRYLPVVELLKGYFGIGVRDDYAKIRDAVTARVVALGPVFEPMVSPLLALLDVPITDDEWHRLEPSQRRQRTIDGLKRLLLRECEVQPLLLVFEDLHWMDSQSQAVLDVLVESLPAARMVLLVNYRPEHRHGWTAKTYYTQLRLDPLPPDNSSAILDGLLGSDPGLGALKERVVAATDGNPLFLEECVRMLIETGALAGSENTYRLTRAVSGLDVPASVQAIIAARIDRLGPDDKRLLQAASVVGKDVPLPVLQRIVDHDATALRRGLERLQAAEFLYETKLFPEPEFTFKHAITHDVTYTGILQERRRTLHDRIVDAIEALYANRGEHVERLAYHAVRAERWDAAAPYLRQAGDRAFVRSAHGTASACYQEARQALERLPETAATLNARIDVRLDLRRSLHQVTDAETAARYLDEAETLAARLGDPRQRARVIGIKTHYRWMRGDPPDQLLSLAQSALEMVGDLGDVGLQIQAHHRLGGICITSGDYRRAVEHEERGLALIPKSLERELFEMTGFPTVLLRSWLSWAHAELGQFEEAMTQGRIGLAIARELAHPYSFLQMAFGFSMTLAVRGDFDAAVSALEPALALATETGFAGWGEAIRLRLVCLRARRDPSSPAGDAMLDAIASGQLQRQTLPVSFLAMEFAEACLTVGRLDVGGECAEAAHRGALLRRQRGVEAYATRALAELAARCGRPDTAAERYASALRIADELGMRPLVAHCHLGLGKLYRRAGKLQEAQEHLTIATTMYGEMDMRFWLEKAQAAMDEGLR